MPKRPKTPRRKRRLIQPALGGVYSPNIGLNQEKWIGRVVVAWAKLEAIMSDFIWHLLKIDIELGRHITTRLDAVAKIKMLREFGPIVLTKDHWRLLSEILERIDILREDRNLIVHGSWGTNPAGEPIAASLRTKPLEPDQAVSESFSAIRMRNIVHDIDAMKLSLMTLMRERGASPNTPPRPHPEG
jgi:hypothetical protein